MTDEGFNVTVACHWAPLERVSIDLVGRLCVLHRKWFRYSDRKVIINVDEL